MQAFRRFLSTCLALSAALLLFSVSASSADDRSSPGNTIEETLIGAGLSMLFHHKAPLCKITQTGWIEPTQGVWQDDDFFEDRPGKQLTQVDGRTYKAELLMAHLRDTLLYGILRPVGQEPNDRRNTIAISGTSTYSTLLPVKVRITLKQLDVSRVLYETPVQYAVNLGGSCLPAPVPFAVVLDASKGIPPPPADPFQMSATGAYTIRAELYDKENHATGLYTEVSGEVVDTAGPQVQFIPVYSGKAGPQPGLPTTAALTATARMLARNVPRYGPMYFPIEADGMSALVRAPRDVDGALARSAAVADAKFSAGDWRKYLATPLRWAGINKGTADPDVVAAQFINDFDGAASLGHVGRLVVLTRGEIAGLINSGAEAFTYSTKVIFATPGIKPLSVLHEIVHTEPVYLWSGAQMISECGHDYHDNDGYTVMRNGVATQVRGVIGGKIHGVAYGVRTQRVLPFEAYGVEDRPGTSDFQWLLHVDDPPTGDEATTFNGESVPQQRQRMDAAYELMGSSGTPPEVPEVRWITQCTYHHLVDDAMQLSQDPHYLLVRTVLAHGRNGWYGGYFEPAYDIEDNALQARPGGGAWSVVALDAGGAPLASYGFEATWKNSDSTLIHNAIPYTLRIPYVPGIAALELRAPTGAVDKLAVSASPPQLRIVAPPDGSTVSDQTVAVHWEASASSGAPLLYSVLYSPDGKTWLDRAFETKQTSLNVVLARNVHKHYIRVIAGDGSRSVEQTVIVNT